MSNTDTSTKDTGLTRRELLKKGAVLGGALVWATPVVQTIGMQAAFAQSTSPDCPNLYCLKADVDDNSLELGNFVPYKGGGRGNCFGTDEDCDPDVPQSLLDFLNDNVTGNLEDGYVVTLPPGCKLADVDDSPVLNGEFAAMAKCGKDCFGADVNGSTITFNCEKDISHIELLICCPDRLN